MDYENLKKYIRISDKYIDVERSFMVKFQLSPWDVREIARLMECVDNYTEATSINKRAVDVLKKFGVVFIEDKVGWSL